MTNDNHTFLNKQKNEWSPFVIVLENHHPKC
jgi:hypothetical protein